jgi:hypothetical protein
MITLNSLNRNTFHFACCLFAVCCFLVSNNFSFIQLYSFSPSILKFIIYIYIYILISTAPSYPPLHITLFYIIGKLNFRKHNQLSTSRHRLSLYRVCLLGALLHLSSTPIQGIIYPETIINFYFTLLISFLPPPSISFYLVLSLSLFVEPAKIPWIGRSVESIRRYANGYQREYRAAFPPAAGGF